ncbi:nucleoside-diphosphate kinase [Nocardia carnea]|uniref:nucleoside-diphosphate kinase n=1 Tax=Nocardia carnea TaxID=37328 RepID=UPI00245773FB|nr:nucleoside-diphosphate kinase [Nocardia carnea]
MEPDEHMSAARDLPDTETGALAGLLAALTPQREKVAAYLSDTYVLESVEQLARLRIDAGGFAVRHSLMLLKPEAIVGRAVDPALKWLSENGFRVVDAVTVAVDRHLVRALWYYAWNIASPERRRLADLLAAVSDCLLLVVSAAHSDLPAPVRLAEATGPADPRHGQPGQLRHRLGQRNTLLSLVHTPDDPADVLRELAIYFGENQRAEVITRAYTGADRAESARELADALYARTPCRSFDPAVAVDRVLRDLDRAGAPVPADFDAGDESACAGVLARALAAGRDIDPWSAVVLGSRVLPMWAATGSPALPPVTAADWRQARG